MKTIGCAGTAAGLLAVLGTLGFFWEDIFRDRTGDELYEQARAMVQNRPSHAFNNFPDQTGSARFVLWADDEDIFVELLSDVSAVCTYKLVPIGRYDDEAVLDLREINGVCQDTSGRLNIAKSEVRLAISLKTNAAAGTMYLQFGV